MLGSRIRKGKEAALAAKKAGGGSAWDQASAEFRAVPGSKEALDSYLVLRASFPSPESTGYLTHHGMEREARAAMLAKAEIGLGHKAETLRGGLNQRLIAADMEASSLVWKRAWNHHWARLVAVEAGLDGVIEAQA